MSKIVFQRNSDKIKTKNNIASIELRLDGLSFSIVTTGGKCLLIKEFEFSDENSFADNLSSVLKQEPLLTDDCNYKQINVVLTTWASTLVPAELFDIRYAENYIFNIGIELSNADICVVSPIVNNTIAVMTVDGGAVQLLKNIANGTPLKFFHTLQRNIIYWQNKPVKSKDALIAYFTDDSVSISVFSGRVMVYADTLRTGLPQEQIYYTKEMSSRYPDIKNCYVYGNISSDHWLITENQWNLLPFISEIYTEL